jgi:hypothetical protein
MVSNRSNKKGQLTAAHVAICRTGHPALQKLTAMAEHQLTTIGDTKPARGLFAPPSSKAEFQ